jgi:hypothetical protein
MIKYKNKTGKIPHYQVVQSFYGKHSQNLKLIAKGLFSGFSYLKMSSLYHIKVLGKIR